MATAQTFKRAETELRDFAMTYPGVHEDFPWGHRAMKVKNKAFVFMSIETQFSLSLKLPSSRDAALLFPFTEPTGYGLGKAGWVSAAFGPKDEIPIEILKKWIDESYRAIAPKKLIASIAGTPAEAAAAPAGKKSLLKKAKTSAKPKAKAKAKTKAKPKAKTKAKPKAKSR